MDPLPNILEETAAAAALSPKESESTSNNSNEENDSYLVCVNFNDNEDEQQVQQQQQSHTDDLNLDQSTRSVASATSNAPLRSSLKRRESINEEELDKISTSIVSNTSNNNIDSNESTSRKIKRNVSFTSLEIRSYPITLGDAPTSNGPPVSLDWEHDPQSTETHEIDSYEQHRTNTRRSKHEMIMPPSYRKYLLMREAGFSRVEIQRAVEEARRMSKKREATRKNLYLQPVEEVLESTKRRIGRLVGRNSSDK
jgi:hypothetical protein